MKKTKLEKGITLVALIITIVVLLILAVVSIGAVRNSGIIGHASDTTSESTVAEENEIVTLAVNEWQLQKNTPDNTMSFKSVVESALENKDVTISGSENGPLTITFSKTGNKYKVTKDGEISKIANLAGTDLEKYIFGEDLVGKDITQIMDMESMVFTDSSVVAVSSSIQDLLEPDVYLYDFYIKYNEEIYKFKIIGDGNNNKYTTEPSYGLTKIVIDTENTRVGKTVSYDGKTWTIMYDDATNGLQMICNETYQYNSNYFYLGYNDSSITDWDSLNTETEDFKIADLDGNKKLNNDLEKAIYSYNNAITTLNNACTSVVTANDNILDVRCVGSNPTSKNSENADFYTSENLAKWPESNSTYSAGIGNGKGKSTDLNYVTDFDRIVGLGINKSDTYYWLASRFVVEDSSNVYFRMRYVYSDGNYNNNNLWNVNDSNANGDYYYNALRPVVSLSSSIQLTPSESGGTTDYVLN